MAGAAAARVTAPVRDAIVLALAAFALCKLLAQDTFYGPDGRLIIKMTMSGLPVHPLHFLYVPMLRASHALVSTWGGSWYDAGLLLSQAGTALGVFAWHRATAWLGESRATTAAVVGLCATTPAILFFGSVVELHAPFLAFAGLAACAAARLAHRGSHAAALALGVSTGLAVGAHATAHLLLLWLAPLGWAMASGRTAPRRWIGLLASAAAAHAAVVYGLATGLRASGAAAQIGSSATFLVEAARRAHELGWLPAQVWHDGLRPFAPLSFLAVAGLFRGGRLGGVFVLGVAASLAVTFALMAPTTENGAYLVPLVWPAALLVVRTLPRLVWVAAMLAGLGLGVRWIAIHDDPEFGRTFVADVRAAAAGAPVDLICGQHPEFDACLIAGPELDWQELIDEANLPPETVPLMLERFREWVASRERAGRIVLLTAGTLAYLDAPMGPEMRTGPLLRRAIEAGFVLEPVHGERLRAWRLRPR